jgi:hypothetical protein
MSMPVTVEQVEQRANDVCPDSMQTSFTKDMVRIEGREIKKR